MKLKANLVRFFRLAQHHFILFFISAVLFYVIGVGIFFLAIDKEITVFLIGIAWGIAAFCVAPVFYYSEKELEKRMYRVRTNPGAGYILSIMFALIGIACLLIAIGAPILMVMQRIGVIEGVF